MTSSYSLEDLNSLKKTELENIAKKCVPDFSKKSTLKKVDLIKLIWDNTSSEDSSAPSYRARSRRSASKSSKSNRSRSTTPSRSRSRSKPPRSRSRSTARSRSRSKTPSDRSRSRSRSKTPRRTKVPVTKKPSRRGRKSVSPPPSPSFPPVEDLSSITLVELKKIAKQYNITSLHTYNKSNRQDLEKLIHQKMGADIVAGDVGGDVKDDLEAKSLKDLKQLLIEKGFTENLPKTKKDIITLLRQPRCDPENNVLCDDGLCEIPNKVCVDKKKKGYDELVINGKVVVGNRESIEKLKNQLKPPVPEPSPSPPSLPPSPSLPSVYTISVISESGIKMITIETLEELFEFVKSFIKTPFQLMIDNENGKELKSSNDLRDNMKIFVKTKKVPKSQPPPLPKSPAKSPRHKKQQEPDNIHNYLQDISTEEDIDLSHLDSLQKQLIQCLFKTNKV